MTLNDSEASGLGLKARKVLWGNGSPRLQGVGCHLSRQALDAVRRQQGI